LNPGTLLSIFWIIVVQCNPRSGAVIFRRTRFGQKIHIASDVSPISEDVSDNLFINLAVDGGAKTIISGDSHLLKLKEFKGLL
jgi:predicted nucleic acid-binding protein